MKLKFQMAFLSLLLTLTGCIAVISDNATYPTTPYKETVPIDRVNKKAKKANDGFNKKPSISSSDNEKPSSKYNRVDQKVKSGTDNLGKAQKKSPISNPNLGKKPNKAAEVKSSSGKDSDSSKNKKQSYTN